MIPGYTLVVAKCMKQDDGTLISNATIAFAPTLTNGTPTPFRAGTSTAAPAAYAAGTTYGQGDCVSSGGTNYVSLAASNTGNTPGSGSAWWLALGAGVLSPGQSASTPITAQITGGSFAVVLPDVSATLPINVCFAITVTDNVSGLTLLNYSSFQPTGAVVNFDTYQPNLAAQVTVQTGPQGPPVSFRGAWSSATTYALGDAVSFTDGSSYISLSSGNLNNAPAAGGTPFWGVLAQAPTAVGLVTISHVFAAAGSYTFAHGLNTLTPLMAVLVQSGATAWSASVVDANNVAITVPAAATIAALFTAGSAGASSTSSTGTDIYWAMTDTSGTSFTSSPAGTPLSIVGGVTLGNPPTFDGTTGYASLASTPANMTDATQPWTLTFRLKSSTTATSQIFGNETGSTPGIACYVQSGKFWVSFAGATSPMVTNWSSTPILDGTEHAIAITYDGSQHGAGILLYVDGTLQAATVGTDTLAGSIVPSYPLLVMAGVTGASSASYFMAGTMRHLHYSNFALTQTQIQTRINSGE